MGRASYLLAFGAPREVSRMIMGVFELACLIQINICPRRRREQRQSRHLVFVRGQGASPTFASRSWVEIGFFENPDNGKEFARLLEIYSP